jgi:hypothetical protein
MWMKVLKDIYILQQIYSNENQSMKEYIEKFKDYKIEFLKRLPPLLEYIIISNTPQSVKEGIANDFSNFSFTIY